MWPIDCIEHKRDGKVLTKEEISRFITDYTAGRVADYQAAAWLMAVYFQGMTYEETKELTLAMAHSGDMVDLSSIPHSGHQSRQTQHRRHCRYDDAHRRALSGGSRRPRRQDERPRPGLHRRHGR